MRRILIAGNWKMYKTALEAANLVATLKAGIHSVAGEIEVVVCPPYTAFSSVLPLFSGSRIQLGAQNMHYETEGAFTGEISPLMIKDWGCRYVILGHSERRSYSHESDELVNKKIRTALKYNLVPIVCIGEWLEEREQGKQFEVVKHQFEGTFKGLTAEDMEKLVIAYEPVWAIGTGKTATPEQAQEMHHFIRNLIRENYGAAAAKVRILYGGSVRSDNILELMAQPDLDGALVGGASLKAPSFVRIAKFQVAA